MNLDKNKIPESARALIEELSPMPPTRMRLIFLTAAIMLTQDNPAFDNPEFSIRETLDETAKMLQLVYNKELAE